MKFNLKLAIVFCLFALASDSLLNAQRNNGPRGGQRGGQRGERSQRQGQGMRGQTPPLLRVFDTDGDGELSPEEIDAAATSLRKLDRDQDGRLTANELRPQGPASGGRPDQSQRGQGRPQQGPGGRQGGRGQGGRGQQGGPRGQQGGRPGGARGGNPAQADASFAEQILAVSYTHLRAPRDS